MRGLEPRTQNGSLEANLNRLRQGAGSSPSVMRTTVKRVPGLDPGIDPRIEDGAPSPHHRNPG
jgi:hypothetical protein